MVRKSRTVSASRPSSRLKTASKTGGKATDVELQLGKRIAALRAAVGFTLDRLAAEAGFTKGYLSKIENSKVIPPIGTLVKIAQVLNTDLAALFGNDMPDAANDEAICVVRSWERETAIRGGSLRL